uniref:MYC associated factor X n=1 Tax=Malurus cyaneus samueli TaxID=2593467 RepID=A0A8C5TG54_9PASS
MDSFFRGSVFGGSLGLGSYGAHQWAWILVEEDPGSLSRLWLFPLLQQASRAQILDKATEYIQYMRRKNHTHQQDIDDLKRQNALLEQQVRALEKARSSAQLQASYPTDNSLYTNPKGSTISAFDGGSDSSSDSEPDEPQNRKKLRMEAS